MEHIENRDAQFIARHSTVFRNTIGNDRSCVSAWGLEVGDGWIQLLDGLCADLARVIEAQGLNGFVVTQVKEKFGGLRFYTQGGNAETQDLVNAAQDASWGICEQCGKLGKTRGAVAVFTACDECAAKRRS